MARQRVLIPFVLLLALLPAFLPTRTVQAAVFAVNTTLDTVDANPGDGVCADSGGHCSLRAAILEANARAGVDTITLPAGTYTLTLAGRDENDSFTGDLDINGSLTITGSGGNANGNPADTIIQAGPDSASGIDKVMSINPYFNNAFTTTLQALTLRYGYNTSSSDGDGYGGGLDWDASGTGRLNITNCVISDNTAVNADGGGLATFNADYANNASQILVTISRTVFTNNHTLRGDGGGLSLGFNAPFSVTDSVISNNSASGGPETDYGNGGGININGVFAVSTISNSLITGNTSSGRNASTYAGSGGGIHAFGIATINNVDYTGYVQINNTTISGNSATGYGGGAWLDGVELNNVTVTNNRGDAGNYGTGSGGGIHSSNDLATYLRNTIVAGNVRGSGSTASDLDGTFNSSKSYNNLIGTGGSAGLTGGVQGNLTGVADPRLGPLANNSGMTQTHALLPGSPALDAGNNAYAPGDFDQRGSSFPRTADAADAGVVKTVDIGAFEASPIIEDLPDRTINMNASLNYEFRFGDSTVSGISISPASSNTALVPNNLANLAIYSGNYSDTRILSISPLAGQSGSTTITVTASAPNGASVSDTFILTVLPMPDLIVTKTHAGNFSQGQTGASFTLTVTNQGLGSSSGTVTLTDTLPAGLTATGLSGTGWTCTLGTLTCTRADVLAGNASYPPVTLTVDVSQTAPTSLTNTASVSNASDSNNNNNTASDPVTVNTSADLVVAKTHAGDFRQGQTGAVYTLTVSNAGSGPTGGSVTVVDSLPAGLTAAGISGSGWTCDLPGLSCSRADALAAGASYPAVTVTVNVAGNAPPLVTNTARVSGGGEISVGNNTASDPTTVIQSADLTVSASHAGDFRQGQAGAQYTLVVANSGSGPTAGAVTLTAALPAGLTAANLAGAGWNCTLATLTCTRSNVLAAGAAYPAVTLAVDVAAGAGPQVTLTVSVSGGGQVVTDNDTASDPTTIIQAADLQVSKTHSGSVAQGQAGAAFTLTVRNTGQGPTVGLVTLTDTLPASMTASDLSGAGWDCTLAALTCTRSDPLAAGGSYPAVTLLVNVLPDAPALVTNEAWVEGGGELNTANNNASDEVSITPLADLAIVKSHAGDFRQGQAGAQYTIRVSNTGHAAHTGTVTVKDTLPAGLTAVGLSGAGWNCTLASVTCTRGDALAVNNHYPDITLTVNVAADAPASLTNQAAVSGGAELSAANNSSEDLTLVAGAADLQVTKSHAGDFRQGQSGAVYSLTVRNAGRGTTTAAVLLEELPPAGLAVTGLSGSGWNCSLSNLTCQRMDSLAPAESFPVVTVTVDVAAGAPGSLTNRARVSGGGELVTGNNEASDPTVVRTRPVVTLHPLSQSVWPGQPASFSAAASGDPAPSVQWQESADSGATWNDLTGETGGTLAFTMSAGLDNRQYRAVFTNEVGTAVSDPALLRVNFAPLVDRHPLSQSAGAGQLVTFSVSVSARPAAQIKWQVSTDGGQTWEDIPGAGGPEYTFRPYLEQNGYQYRAVASNAGGSAESNPAVLTVHENLLFFPFMFGW